METSKYNKTCLLFTLLCILFVKCMDAIIVRTFESSINSYHHFHPSALCLLSSIWHCSFFLFSNDCTVCGSPKVGGLGKTTIVCGKLSDPFSLKFGLIMVSIDVPLNVHCVCNQLYNNL